MLARLSPRGVSPGRRARGVPPGRTGAAGPCRGSRPTANLLSLAPIHGVRWVDLVGSCTQPCAHTNVASRHVTRASCSAVPHGLVLVPAPEPTTANARQDGGPGRGGREVFTPLPCRRSAAGSA
jgi:hypothetical protein